MKKVIRIAVMASALVGGAAQAQDFEFELDLAKGCKLATVRQDEAPRVVCSDSQPPTVELRAAQAGRLATMWGAGKSETRMEPRLGTAAGPLTIAIGY